MGYEEPNVLVPEAVDSHGNTVAAWFLVVAGTIGLLVATIAFCSFHALGTWIGIIIIAVGMLGSLVLKAAGFGKGGKHTKAHA